jgi:hypothetical protein
MYRIPIEIWTLILHFACASPFSPFLDQAHNHLSTSVILNEKLFDHERHISKQYQDFDNFITTFRLVCRTWAAIVDSLGRRYIFTDKKKTSYPPCYTKKLWVVERIYILDSNLRTHCFCGKGAKTCRLYECKSKHKVLQRQHQKWWRMSGADLQEALRNVKILSQTMQFYPDKLLEAAKNIRALSMSIGNDMDRLNMPSFRNLAYLSHLSLCDIYAGSFFEAYAAGSINLPHVEYLVLENVLYHLSSRPPSVFSQTFPSFPRLKTLIIKSHIGLRFDDAFNHFFMDCGRTVREFVELPNPYARNIEPKTLPELAKYFPNLHLYGISLQSSLESSISSQADIQDAYFMLYIPKSTSFTLLLYDFEAFLLRLNESARLLNVVTARWKITHIMMNQTWDKLHGVLVALPPPDIELALVFLGTLNKSLQDKSISFTDCEGVGYRNGMLRRLGWSVSEVNDGGPRPGLYT